MSKPVAIDPAAKAELTAEVNWYDRTWPGLGDELMSEVRQSMRLIGEVPSIGTPAVGVPRSLQVRKLLLKRFPHAIIFVETPEAVQVIAFAHGRRKPGYWRERLR